MNNENLTPELLFKNEAKDPFSYNIDLNAKDNISVFENVKNIFVIGLKTKFGDSLDNLEISTKDKILHLNEYMLSIGIKVNYRRVDSEERDFLYRTFLYDVKTLDCFDKIDITIVVNWKTDFIKSINLNVPTKDKSVIQKITNLSKKHTSANHFLKITPPEQLKEYAIFVNISNEKDVTHVINFDFANVGDYGKAITNVTGPWQG